MPKLRKESMPWKPSNLILPNSNSKVKNNSVNAKKNNSSSSSLAQNIGSPTKPQGQTSNSSSNLFLNLESPIKLDAMKNLVNKKNSNVNARKLDE